MINIEELVEKFLNLKKEEMLYYSVKDDNLFIINEHMLVTKEIPVNGRTIQFDELLGDSADYFPILSDYEDIIFQICINYLKYLEEQHYIVPKTLFNSLNTARNKVNPSFFKKLEKMGLKDDFERLKKIQIKFFLENLLADTNFIKITPIQELVDSIFHNMALIQNLEPWKTFSNVDLIKVKIPKIGLFYVSILGHAATYYGLSIYHEDDFELYELIHHEEISQMMVSSLQENFTVYYEDIDTMRKNPMAELYFKSKKAPLKNNMGGYFIKFNKYSCPTINISNHELTIFDSILEALARGIKQMKEKKLNIDFADEQSLSINYRQNHSVTTKPYNLTSITYNKNVDVFEFSKYKKHRKGSFGIKLIALEPPIKEKNMVSPVWLYTLIIFDKNTGLYLQPISAFKKNGISPFFIIQKALNSLFKKDGIPDIIRVEDEITADLLYGLEKQCHIEYKPLSNQFHKDIKRMKIPLKEPEAQA